MDSFSENISSVFGYILDIIASERIRKLVARGEIQREGIGRATKYKRLK